MSTGNSPDPEQLIAEALRAQAARVPVVPTGALPAHQPACSGDETVAHPVHQEPVRQQPVRQESAGDPSTSGYGLLSGMDSGLALLAGDSLRFTGAPTLDQTTDHATGPAGVGTRGTTRLDPPRISLGAALLLAVLLGFAAGAVVGLVTLL